MAVESQIAFARIQADLNLVVRYGIAIHVHVSKRYWWILIWRQIAKLPNLIPRQIFQLYSSSCS